MRPPGFEPGSSAWQARQPEPRPGVGRPQLTPVQNKELRELGADFYVFLTYVPRFGERSVRTFENRFVIVPVADLEKLVAGKSSGKKGVYSFYLSFDGERVTETRDGKADYSEYLDRWGLIKKALF